MVTTRQNCLSGAKAIVSSQSIFPLPDENQALGYGKAVAEAGSDALKLSSDRTVQTAGTTAGTALQAGQVLETFGALKSAYDSCR